MQLGFPNQCRPHTKGPIQARNRLVAWIIHCCRKSLRRRPACCSACSVDVVIVVVSVRVRLDGGAGGGHKGHQVISFETTSIHQPQSTRGTRRRAWLVRGGQAQPPLQKHSDERWPPRQGERIRAVCCVRHQQAPICIIWSVTIRVLGHAHLETPSWMGSVPT